MGDNVTDPVANRKHKIRVVQAFKIIYSPWKHTQGHIPHTQRKQAKLIYLNTDKLAGL